MNVLCIPWHENSLCVNFKMELNWHVVTFEVLHWCSLLSSQNTWCHCLKRSYCFHQRWKFYWTTVVRQSVCCVRSLQLNSLIYLYSLLLLSWITFFRHKILITFVALFELIISKKSSLWAVSSANRHSKTGMEILSLLLAPSQWIMCCQCWRVKHRILL